MESNGLKADFRFIRHHPYDNGVSYVETATGCSWIYDDLLTYDVVKAPGPAKPRE